MSTSVEDYLLWHWFGNVSSFLFPNGKYLNVMLHLFTFPFNSSTTKNTKKIPRFCFIAKIFSSLFRFVKAKMKKRIMSCYLENKYAQCHTGFSYTCSFHNNNSTISLSRKWAITTWWRSTQTTSNQSTRRIWRILLNLISSKYVSNFHFLLLWNN